MLEAFYRDYYPTVYGYLLSLCGDPLLAEELAAETFCRALAHIDQYDPRYRASTWLCTIGRNLYFDHCRRAKRLVPLEDAAPVTLPSAETVHLQREALRLLWEQLSDLPQPTRQVVIMRLQEMPFSEIGQILGRTEVWARVTFYRAKAHIRKELEDEA